MRTFTAVMIVVMALSVAGCAKKTATEQLRDDMKKASNQLNKELGSL